MPGLPPLVFPVWIDLSMILAFTGVTLLVDDLAPTRSSETHPFFKIVQTCLFVCETQGAAVCLLLDTFRAYGPCLTPYPHR